DVYTVHLPLPGDSRPLVLGQVLTGMKPDDPPLDGPKNDPMMPVAWVRTYTGTAGKPARVFTTTMGASQDLERDGPRRLLCNAASWAVELDEKLPPRSDVAMVGESRPNPFKFGGFTPGVKPGRHAQE